MEPKFNATNMWKTNEILTSPHNLKTMYKHQAEDSTGEAMVIIIVFFCY